MTKKMTPKHRLFARVKPGQAAATAAQLATHKRQRSLVKEIVLMLRFLGEFIRGAYTFYRVNYCITVYGSARFTEDNPYYQTAQKLGEALAKAGFAVMTGGGPGIMEAANRGAKAVVDSLSVGCAIALPFEEKMNDYLDKTITLRYFFSRKLMLSKHSVGFIAFPGGLGTLDELFEIAVLVQTKRIEDYPIVLIGTHFWSPLITYLRGTLVAEKTIGDTDVDDIFFLTDSIEEAIAYIKRKIDYNYAEANKH